ncbi:hypothetical protein PG999_001581 [Apiospora kogelbergensis]|uniref:Uncharacterized protein n=1 Tax=Apiospora kogelbergensis TaxID=1337665 RepID=A0AAW0R5Y0_9PEZI
MENPQIPAAVPSTTKASVYGLAAYFFGMGSRLQRKQNAPGFGKREDVQYHDCVDWDESFDGYKEGLSATEYDQTSQSRSGSGMVSESSGVPTSIPLTASALPAMTPAHWPEGSVARDNGLGSQDGLAWSQDQPRLQDIPAVEVDSNHLTNSTMVPTSHTSSDYNQGNQSQWSAINDYLNSPPRNDAWSPLVMPVQERGVERDPKVDDSQAITDGGNDEESGLKGA